MYDDASISKSEIINNYKNIPLIHMWFNKITKVYVGSYVHGIAVYQGGVDYIFVNTKNK